ncbi:RHS repeat-associated protein [Xanthomonas arboricola]|nr:RHS repeat-associated protein [Xanthomonas sp. 3307]
MMSPKTTTTSLLVKSALRYVQPDHLGTPREVIDPTRDLAIWRWDLKGEAFGSTAPDQDPDKDGTAFVFDMRFPGQRYDALSGLNQNYFRDYEPGTGRYVQSDPLGLTAGASTYAYVSARPLQGVDSLGLADDFYLPTEVPETPELQAVRSRLQGLANRAEATVDATCGLRCALPWIRGTLIHSEFKRLVDTTCPASDYATEISYKGGIVVRYGAEDSSRADVVYSPIDRPKVVFDLKTGLAYLTWGQFNAYGKNLPLNTPVSVIRPEGVE